MHWPTTKEGSGSRHQLQRRKIKKKHRREQQQLDDAHDTEQQQDQDVEEEQQSNNNALEQQQQQQQQKQRRRRHWQHRVSEAADCVTGVWGTLLASATAQEAWGAADAGPSTERHSSQEDEFYPAHSSSAGTGSPVATPASSAVAMLVRSMPLLSCTSTTSSGSLPFADMLPTPPTSPFAKLAVSGAPFGSEAATRARSDTSGDNDAAAPLPMSSVPEPTRRLPLLPCTVAAAAQAAAASLAITSALHLQPSAASYASSLGRASTASDTSSSSGAAGGGVPGGLLRVDTVPLLSLLARADTPPDSVATVPSGSGSGSDSGDAGLAVPGVPQGVASDDAAADGKPALSQARARLIARLQQRQRERELEEAASCDLAAYFGSSGGGCPPPAERARDGLVLASGGAMIPHVAKTETGGEDAFFITESGHGSLGVADGVSSWADDGVDPGEYSRALVQNLQQLMEQLPTAGPVHFEGRSVLRRAQMATFKPGSATVVLAALRPRSQGGAGAPASSSSTAGSSSHGEALDAADWDSDNVDGDGGSSSGGSGGSEGLGGSFELHISNLGDCGVKVVRDGRIVLSTRPQQHDFNLPYQMSHPRLFPETDIADSADRYVVEVREGDVIIAASDGLFDNMWDDQLLTVLSDALSGRAPPPFVPPRLRRASSSFKALGSKLKRGGNSKGNLLPSNGSFSALRRVASEEVGAQQTLTGSPPPCPSETSATAAAVPAVDVDPDSIAPAQLAQRAAEWLARVAFRNAADDRFKSPWAAAAKRQGLLARLFAHGGKMDDCTVVVAIVRDVRAVAGASTTTGAS